MRGWVGALALLCAGCPAAAQEPAGCAIPDHLVVAEHPLPRVAAAVRERRLTIAVVGSGSTTLAGADGAAAAYPARLQAALAARLPDLPVKVVPFAKGRETAQDMAKNFPRILADARPDLVIWQTGTVDAIRGVDADQFRQVLEGGIRTVKRGRADIMMMNMQYSPRTESVIALTPYADTMRVIAQQASVPLFDRLALMRQWSESGEFDLYAARKDTVLAKRVHDCIGKAIAVMIVNAGGLAGIIPSRSR